MLFASRFSDDPPHAPAQAQYAALNALEKLGGKPVVLRENAQLLNQAKIHVTEAAAAVTARLAAADGRHPEVPAKSTAQISPDQGCPWCWIQSEGSQAAQPCAR